MLAHCFLECQCLRWSSHLPTSLLPWFMDVTFQAPMQYCPLQHQTLVSPPDTSTTWHCFCFGSVSSFFLGWFLCSSPIVYWTPSDLGGLSFSVIVFCLFILFMWFPRQEYWSALPFPSPVDHFFFFFSVRTLHHNHSVLGSPEQDGS